MRDPSVDSDVPSVALCCDSKDAAQRLATTLRSPSFRLLPTDRAGMDRVMKTERPNVILLDAAADESGALDVCRRLTDAPVIAMLSPARPGAVARAREAGATEVIMSPVAPSEFALRVRAVRRLIRMQTTVSTHSEDA